jgi:hypothetical protein
MPTAARGPCASVTSSSTGWRSARAPPATKLYALHADVLHDVAIRSVCDPTIHDDLLDHREDIIDLDRALDQLGWCADIPADQQITARRQTLSDAVHTALLTAIDDLRQHCHDYQVGHLHVGDLMHDTTHIRDLLEFYGYTELVPGYEVDVVR